MRLSKLNGWQRLWLLSSIIYLTFMVFIAIVDFPSPEKIFITDDEIIKNLSTETLIILDKAEKSTPKWKVDLNNGHKITVPVNTTEADLEYIAKDYNYSIHKITSQKRITFIGTRILVWILPCLVVYVLGLSLHWVYKGFIKVE